MKTLKGSLLQYTVLIVLSAALITSTSCQNKKAATSETNPNSGVTPPEVDVHAAVITGNLEAVEQHIAAGSDLNVKDPFGGSSPLISASLFGKTEIARALINAGADINFQNNDGSTALHTSSFFCRPEIVKLLLDKGADKTIKNKYRSTAYESMIVPFKDVKPVYEMMGKALGSMVLKLDYVYT